MLETLRTCSRCRTSKLQKYFSFNTKRHLYKLCDNCRTPGFKNLTNIVEKYLNLYRPEYEEYMGTSSYDTSKQLFTEQEQIIRYSKHLGFWMMKYDLIQSNKPPD